MCALESQDEDKIGRKLEQGALGYDERWNNKGKECARQRVGTSIIARRGLGWTQSDSDMVPQPAEFDRFGLEGNVLANVSTLRSHMV